MGSTDKEVQTLRNRVLELEQQLADAKSTIFALTSSEHKKRQTKGHDHSEQAVHKTELKWEGENAVFLANEERLYSALMAAPFPLMIRRDDGRVIMINAAWTEITGYTLEDIPTIAEWTRNAYGEAWRQRQSLILNEGFSQEGVKKWGELEVTTRFGEKRIWDFSTASLGIDSKGRRLAMTMAVDITHRRKAEEALEQSQRRQREINRLLEVDQARLAAILRHLPVGVWIADQQGRLIGSNEEAERIWRGELPLLSSTAEYQKYVAWHPESGKLLESEEYPVAVTLRTGQPVEPIELKIRRFDGSEGTVLVSAAPIKDNQGLLMGAVGVNVDITDRQRAEKERRRAEARYTTLFNSVREGFAHYRAVYDVQGKIVDVLVVEINPAGARLSGVAREEQIGKTWRQVWPSVDDQLFVMYQRADETGEIIRFDDYSRLTGRIYDVVISRIAQGEFIVTFNDITERKQAEQTLLENQEYLHQLNLQLEQRNAEVEIERMRWQSVVEGIADEVWVCDAQGKMSLINLGTVTAMGLEEFKDKSVDEVLQEVEILYANGQLRPPEQAPLLRSLSGEIVRGEEIMRHRWTGKVRYRQYSSAPTRDAQGRITGAVAIVRDITEFKQAQEQIAYQAWLLANVNDAIVGSDAQFRLTAWNTGAEAMYGWKAEEVLGQNGVELLQTQWPEDDANEMRRKIAATGRWRGEATQLRKDGSRIPVEISSVVLRDASGQITGYVSVNRDVTERKKAEQALGESEQRLKHAQEIAHLGSWELDLVNNQLTWSDEVYRIFGLQPQEFSATYEAFLEAVHPDDRAAVDAAYFGSIQAGQDSYEIEHRVIKRSSGEVRIVHEKCEHFRNEAGEIIRSVGMVHDITERKHAEEQLKDYAERLERSNRALEQFAFMASHDLQEPLRKIETFGDLLGERAAQLDERGRDYVERMRNAAKRMRDMVEGLLQLSRVTTQGKPFVQMNLSQITSEVLSDLEDQIRRTGGEVDLRSLPTIEGDPLQLRQMMQNLIGNALKYHQPGTPPKVKVYAKQLSDKVQILVEDQGIGFEQEDAERIFQPFQRLVGRSQYEGSGMGLAICHRIVERHGGEIAAVSKPGRGTTIIVTLPSHHSENMGNELEKDASDEESSTTPGR